MAAEVGAGEEEEARDGISALSPRTHNIVGGEEQELNCFIVLSSFCSVSRPPDFFFSLAFCEKSLLSTLPSLPPMAK